ncbi:DUF2188 domain-containing protein [Cupriavidus taiwanensis]|uniref:DUF2188 domain-containing protein n=1 Tax=Cupriavidus taiwanensis TaxID=164546 RepID=UPI000E181F80|nr:conserved hypothetical protein [Cupriavidus taiwanensis]
MIRPVVRVVPGGGHPPDETIQGWDVTSEGTDGVTTHFVSQRLAMESAIQLAKRVGAELFIHDGSGKLCLYAKYQAQS